MKAGVTPVFRQFLIRLDRQHAKRNVDAASRQAGRRNILGISDIDNQSLRVALQALLCLKMIDTLDRGHCLFGHLHKRLIPTGINQNPWAHFRRPIDMIFQG